MNVYLFGAVNRQLEELLHASGSRTTMCTLDGLSGLAAQSALPAEAVVIDLRERSAVPASVALLKRHHPLLGVVIVASTLDPMLMLEAMRAGVTEFGTEPVTQNGLKSTIDSVTE